MTHQPLPARSHTEYKGLGRAPEQGYEKLSANLDTTLLGYVPKVETLALKAPTNNTIEWAIKFLDITRGMSSRARRRRPTSCCSSRLWGFL